MKKIFTSISALILFALSFASAPIKSTLHPLHASQIIIPVGNAGVNISLFELSKITKPGLEKITGRKMNTVQSVVFKRAQHKIKKGIGSDGMVTDKQIKHLFEDDVKKGFNTGGFLLGAVVGLIGVLVAYLIDDKNKKNRVKWAWIGLGVRYVIAGIIVIIILTNFPVQ